MKIFPEEFDKTKPPNVYYKNKPSEEFNDAVDRYFCHGSCYGYCQMCGRSFVNENGGWDFEEGELEEFEANAKKYPGWYLYLDYTVPIADNLFGYQTVVECPCNGAVLFERILWNGRRLIADYYERRTKAEIKHVEAIKDVNESVKKNVNPPPERPKNLEKPEGRILQEGIRPDNMKID